jgi:hypothetical protein
MRPFSAYAQNSSWTNRPAQDRVVSTPEWPVPYYQRLYRAYPTRHTDHYDLSGVGQQFDDQLVYSAKHSFGSTVEGRAIVTDVENNMELDSNYSPLPKIPLTFFPLSFPKNLIGLF